MRSTRASYDADVEPVDVVDLGTSVAWLTEDDADDGRRRRLLQVVLAGMAAP